MLHNLCLFKEKAMLRSILIIALAFVSAGAIPAKDYYVIPRITIKEKVYHRM
jgi:hypothetical protein